MLSVRMRGNYINTYCLLDRFCLARCEGIRNPKRGIWNPLYGIQNPHISMESRIYFGGNPWVRNPESTTRDPGSTIRDPESHGLGPRFHYIGRSVPCHSTLFVARNFFFYCFWFSVCSVGSSFWSSFILGTTDSNLGNASAVKGEKKGDSFQAVIKMTRVYQELGLLEKALSAPEQNSNTFSD